MARPTPVGTDPDIGAFELSQSGTLPIDIVGTEGDDSSPARPDPTSCAASAAAIGFTAAPAKTRCSATPAATCSREQGNRGSKRRAALPAALLPDLNPIQQAFAKLKALLRKAAQRTVDGLWTAIGRLLDLFPPAECANYLAN